VRESLDPKTRFSDRAEIYARSRPSYPLAAGKILHEIVRPAWTAEMAAGTGLFTQTLLEAGHTVTALEPNAEMREEARRRLGGKITLLSGSAEETGLETGSVPMIVAAQAFHWFDRERTRAEWLRILIPDGWVALVRNIRDASAAPEQWDGHRAITNQFRLDVQPHPPYESDADSVKGFMRVVGRFQFVHADSLTREDVLARMLSFSAMPLPGSSNYPDAERSILDWFDKFNDNGRLNWPLVTNVLVGKIAL